MNQPEPTSARFKLQHFVIAIIAIVVAVAMALNFYIW